MNITSRRRLLQDRIHQLSATEHNEIFKILSRYDVQYTKNSNGCFFNLVHVSAEALTEIEKFVHYCLENEQKIDDYNKLLNTYKVGGTVRSAVVINKGGGDEARGEEEDGKKKGKKKKASALKKKVSVAESDEDDGSSSAFSEEGGVASSVEDFEEEEVAAPAAETLLLTQEKQMELRRKALSKFVVARKKFAKRHVQDKKLEISESDFLWSKEGGPD